MDKIRHRLGTVEIVVALLFIVNLPFAGSGSQVDFHPGYGALYMVYTVHCRSSHNEPVGTLDLLVLIPSRMNSAL